MFVIWHYVIRWGSLGFWILLAAGALVGGGKGVHATLGLISYLFIPVCVCGAIMGLLWAMGKLRFACPQCQSKDTELHHNHGNGMALFCNDCGPTEEVGLFKLRLKHTTLAELELQQQEYEDEEEDASDDEDDLEDEAIDTDTVRKKIGGHYER